MFILATHGCDVSIYKHSKLPNTNTANFWIQTQQTSKYKHSKLVTIHCVATLRDNIHTLFTITTRNYQINQKKSYLNGHTTFNFTTSHIWIYPVKECTPINFKLISHSKWSNLVTMVKFDQNGQIWPVDNIQSMHTCLLESSIHIRTYLRMRSRHIRKQLTPVINARPNMTYVWDPDTFIYKYASMTTETFLSNGVNSW